MRLLSIARRAASSIRCAISRATVRRGRCASWLIPPYLRYPRERGRLMGPKYHNIRACEVRAHAYFGRRRACATYGASIRPSAVTRIRYRRSPLRPHTGAVPVAIKDPNLAAARNYGKSPALTRPPEWYITGPLRKWEVVRFRRCRLGRVVLFAYGALGKFTTPPRAPGWPRPQEGRVGGAPGKSFGR